MFDYENPQRGYLELANGGANGTECFAAFCSSAYVEPGNFTFQPSRLLSAALLWQEQGLFFWIMVVTADW